MMQQDQMMMNPQDMGGGVPPQQQTPPPPRPPQPPTDDYNKVSQLPSEKDQEKAVKFVNDTYEFYAKSRESTVYRGYSLTNRIDYKKLHKSIEDKWLEYWMLYRQIPLASSSFNDGRAKMSMGKSFQIINLIVPRIEQVIFGNRSWFSTTGFEEKDFESADKLKKLLYWNMEIANVRSKLAVYLNNYAVLGTNVLRVFWNTNSSTEIKRRTVGSLRNGTTQDQQEYQRVVNQGTYTDESLVPMEISQLDADHADCEIVDPAMFYMHPTDTNINNNPVIEKRYVSYDSLKRNSYYFKENVKKVKDSSMSSDEYDWFMLEKQKMAGVGSADNTSILTGDDSDMEGKKHQLLVSWGHYPIDSNDKDKDGNINKPMCEIHVLNKKYIVCMRKSPYWYADKVPYIVGRYHKNEGEAYGESALSPSIKQLRLLDTTLSQIADNMSLVLSAPMRARASLKLPSIMRLLPGQTVNFPDQYDPSKDMVPINIPDVSSSGWNNIAQLEQRIEADTGAVKLLAGMSAGGGIDNTLGGINAALGEANTRFKSAIWHFQEDVVRELIRWFAKLNQQFLTIQKQVRIINPDDPTTFDTVNVTPEDINIDCDFIMANAATELDKAKNKQSFMEFVQVGNHYEDPNTGGYKESARPILKQMWEVLDREDWNQAAKDLFPPPPPPPEPGSSIDEQELAQKAQNDQQKILLESERVKTEKIRVFGEFIRNMGIPDPAKADLYKAFWVGLGLPAEDWEGAEMLLFGGQLIASKLGATGPDPVEVKGGVSNGQKEAQVLEPEESIDEQ